MKRALFGTLLATCLVIGCNKDKEQTSAEPAPVNKVAAKRAAAKKAAARKAAAKRNARPPEPDTTCTFAEGEKAEPPALTFQNGLAVQPKAKPYTGTTDATVDESAPAENTGTGAVLTSLGGKALRRALVRWDLSSLPADTTIKGACMAVFVETPSSRSTAVFELLKDWSEPKVTWASATTDKAWELAGAWGQTDAGAKVSAIPGKASGLQKVVLPTELVQKWIKEKGSNHGVIIAGTNKADELSISSANSPTATQRPALLIWK